MNPDLIDHDARVAGRRKWVIARRLVLLTVCFGGVVAFAGVSATINGQPSMRPFTGWVAVLQRGAPPSENQVLLSANAEVPGARGDRPVLTYSVAVCGKRPFDGVLLMGGDARLVPVPGVRMITGSTRTSRGSVKAIPRLTFESVSFGSPIDLGAVQRVDLAIAQPFPCVERFAAPVSAPRPFLGVAITVTGVAGAPVQRSWTVPGSLWRGPRTSQVWPLLGTFPGVSPQELGEFRAVEGLAGSWSRPRREYASVYVGALTERAALEFARPTPSDLTALRWDGVPGLRPAARIVNSDEMTAWQQRLVLATILLSIGGSVVASLLLTGFRTQHAPVVQREEPTTQPRIESDSNRLVASVTAIGLLLLILVKPRRRR